MQSFLSRILRFLFSLILAAFGLVFAASFLVAALVMLLVGLVRWAVTGKKPAPVVAFGQFQKFRAGQRNPFSSKPTGRPSASADVVDADVREVPDAAQHDSPVKDAKLPP